MFARGFIPVNVYFLFSIPLFLTYTNKNGDICEVEFLMLIMEVLILSLSRINRHTLSMRMAVRTKETDDVTKETDNVTAFSSEQLATGIPTCVEGRGKDKTYEIFPVFLFSAFQFQFNVNITMSPCLHGVIIAFADLKVKFSAAASYKQTFLTLNCKINLRLVCNLCVMNFPSKTRRRKNSMPKSRVCQIRDLIRLGPYEIRLSLSLSVIWMFLDSKSSLAVYSQWCRGKMGSVRMTKIARTQQFMIYL